MVDGVDLQRPAILDIAGGNGGVLLIGGLRRVDGHIQLILGPVVPVDGGQLGHGIRRLLTQSRLHLNVGVFSVEIAREQNGKDHADSPRQGGGEYAHRLCVDFGQGPGKAYRRQTQDQQRHDLVDAHGPVDLGQGVEGGHRQAAQQGGQQVVLLPLSPPAEQGDSGTAQEKEEGEQPGNPHLQEDLDIVVVNIGRLIVEILHTKQLTFKAAQSAADDGALGIDAQTVLEEGQALDGVLVGPQALDAVGDEAGEEQIAQLDPRPIGKRQRLQPVPFPALEIQVDHPCPLRDGEGGPLHGTAVEHGAGVYDGVHRVLALHRHADLPRPVSLQGIGPRLRVDRPAQRLAGIQGIASSKLEPQQDVQAQAPGQHPGSDQGLPLSPLQMLGQAQAAKFVQRPQDETVAKPSQVRNDPQGALTAPKAGHGYKAKEQGGNGRLRQEDKQGDPTFPPLRG